MPPRPTRSAPDAIICDYHLGGPPDGAALVSALRTACLQSQIIVLSADTAARAEALAAGANAFHNKGLGLGDLDRLMQQRRDNNVL
jgi:DNA-binding NarL/FixJ family response regulator